ncbi:hypothetical protein [uncultured Shewanella sp.]|uniref:hypothetical protein n=1 Tax=uncultured Shewanella sp. TaxID=173975 RepID=UPI0026022CF5|nr:hypothetical protein [uncultured Shewanella sp.]
MPKKLNVNDCASYAFYDIPSTNYSTNKHGIVDHRDNNRVHVTYYGNEAYLTRVNRNYDRALKTTQANFPHVLDFGKYNFILLKRTIRALNKQQSATDEYYELRFWQIQPNQKSVPNPHWPDQHQTIRVEASACSCSISTYSDKEPLEVCAIGQCWFKNYQDYYYGTQEELTDILFAKYVRKRLDDDYKDYKKYNNARPTQTREAFVKTHPLSDNDLNYYHQYAEDKATHRLNHQDEVFVYHCKKPNVPYPSSKEATIDPIHVHQFQAYVQVTDLFEANLDTNVNNLLMPDKDEIKENDNNNYIRSSKSNDDEVANKKSSMEQRRFYMYLIQNILGNNNYYVDFSCISMNCYSVNQFSKAGALKEREPKVEASQGRVTILSIINPSGENIIITQDSALEASLPLNQQNDSELMVTTSNNANNRRDNVDHSIQDSPNDYALDDRKELQPSNEDDNMSAIDRGYATLNTGGLGMLDRNALFSPIQKPLPVARPNFMSPGPVTSSNNREARPAFMSPGPAPLAGSYNQQDNADYSISVTDDLWGKLETNHDDLCKLLHSLWTFFSKINHTFDANFFSSSLRTNRKGKIVSKYVDFFGALYAQTQAACDGTKRNFNVYHPPSKPATLEMPLINAAQLDFILPRLIKDLLCILFIIRGRQNKTYDPLQHFSSSAKALVLPNGFHKIVAGSYNDHTQRYFFEQYQGCDLNYIRRARDQFSTQKAMSKRARNSQIYHTVRGLLYQNKTMCAGALHKEEIKKVLYQQAYDSLQHFKSCHCHPTYFK